MSQSELQNFLRASADGDGGDGAGTAMGVQPDAPVSRAEFAQLKAMLEQLGSSLKQPQTPPAPPAPQQPGDLGSVQLQLAELQAERAKEKLSARRSQLESALLADLPEVNRELGGHVLQSLLTRGGVDLGAAGIDMDLLASQLRSKLPASLRHVPGSQYSAIPRNDLAVARLDWLEVSAPSELCNVCYHPRVTIVTDSDQIIQRLERELEEARDERDGLLTAIAEHVEALGGEGNDAIALRDSLGQIERLLAGKDIDAGLGLQGVSGQVEAIVYLIKHVGNGDVAKAEEFFARLDFSGGGAG